MSPASGVVLTVFIFVVRAFVCPITDIPQPNSLRAWYLLDLNWGERFVGYPLGFTLVKPCSGDIVWKRAPQIMTQALAVLEREISAEESSTRRIMEENAKRESSWRRASQTELMR